MYPDFVTRKLAPATGSNPNRLMKINKYLFPPSYHRENMAAKNIFNSALCNQMIVYKSLNNILQIVLWALNIKLTRTLWFYVKLNFGYIPNI